MKDFLSIWNLDQCSYYLLELDGFGRMLENDKWDLSQSELCDSKQLLTNILVTHGKGVLVLLANTRKALCWCMKR
jgi:hypothetical protein